MPKRANYDDLVGFKTPTQRRNDAQVAMILADMKRIDSVLASGSEDELKALHIDLDGTYQNLIRNWDKSVWGYAPKFGFNYELLGESSLRDNLTTIRGKLRGHLLDLGVDVNQVIEPVKNNYEEKEMNISKYDEKKVFIVHGHDEQLLNEVELMIRRIGMEPIILKNEASGGRTIIEKIEHYSDVGFGIVLYTCCDEGRKKGTSELHDRARQNVIFEHGYLCAKLSRERVVALNDPGIEVPSDLAGVVYVSHADADWKNQIMKEMRNAGMEFDSTKA